MNYKHIHYFVALAEAGSFTAASAQLNITQPALSNRVKELETAFGAQLFERHGGVVSLTEAGRKFLPFATDAVRAVGKAMSSFDSIRLSSETVRVGVTSSLGVLLTPTLISAFRSEGLQIVIRQGSGIELIALIHEQKLDAAFCFEAPPAPKCSVTRLFSLELYLVGPRASSRRPRKTVKFRELSTFPLVLCGRDNAHRQVLLRAEVATGIKLDVRAEVDPYDVQRVVMVRHNFSTIALLPLFLDDIEGGRFDARLVVDPKITITARLVTLAKREKRLAQVRRILLGVADQVNKPGRRDFLKPMTGWKSG